MQIESIDHIVLPTQDLEKCLHFYRDLLNMTVTNANGRYALTFVQQKINIHQKKAEFLPTAKTPTYGSLDLCFITEQPIESILDEIQDASIPTETDPPIVDRIGAKGPMRSVYVRDPDGNLVEIAQYI